MEPIVPPSPLMEKAQESLPPPPSYVSVLSGLQLRTEGDLDETNPHLPHPPHLSLSLCAALSGLDL